MGHREGVGSVLALPCLRQQGPKQPGLNFSFLWGSTKQRAEPWAIPATPQNKDLSSTSKSPDTGDTSSSEKNRDLFCGSTFTSEFFPPDPPAHLALGNGGSREQLGSRGAGEKGMFWEEQGSSRLQELPTADNVPV